MNNDEIRKQVDRYADLTRQQEEIKAQIAELKAYFESLGINALKDTKLKSIDFWGTNNSHATVTQSETVKIISITQVKDVLGRLFNDYVNEKTTHEFNAAGKRFFNIAFQGNYTEGSLNDTIQSITDNEKIQKALKKKLKGNYEKDKATLMQFAGLSEQEASDWAYLLAEVINWEYITQILQSAGWDGKTDEALKIIHSAVTVEEGVKIKLEDEKKG